MPCSSVHSGAASLDETIRPHNSWITSGAHPTRAGWLNHPPKAIKDSEAPHKHATNALHGTANTVMMALITDPAMLCNQTPNRVVESDTRRAVVADLVPTEVTSTHEVQTAIQGHEISELDRVSSAVTRRCFA